MLDKVQPSVNLQSSDHSPESSQMKASSITSSRKHTIPPRQTRIFHFSDQAESSAEVSSQSSEMSTHGKIEQVIKNHNKPKSSETSSTDSQCNQTLTESHSNHYKLRPTTPPISIPKKSSPLTVSASSASTSIILAPADQTMEEDPGASLKGKQPHRTKWVKTILGYKKDHPQTRTLSRRQLRPSHTIPALSPRAKITDYKEYFVLNTILQRYFADSLGKAPQGFDKSDINSRVKMANIKDAHLIKIEGSSLNNYGLRINRATAPASLSKKRTRIKGIEVGPFSFEYKEFEKVSRLKMKATGLGGGYYDPETHRMHASLNQIINIGKFTKLSNTHPTVILANGYGTGDQARNAAQLASQKAEEVIAKWMDTQKNSPGNIIQKQLEAITVAHEALTQRNQGSTTLTLATIVGGHLMAVNVGDNKIFILRPAKQSSQRENQAPTCFELKMSSSPKAALSTIGVFPKSTEKMPCELSCIVAALQYGDRVIICSEGAYSNFDPERLGLKPADFSLQGSSWKKLQNEKSELMAKGLSATFKDCNSNAPTILDKALSHFNYHMAVPGLVQALQKSELRVTYSKRDVSDSLPNKKKFDLHSKETDWLTFFNIKAGKPGFDTHAILAYDKPEEPREGGKKTLVRLNTV